MLGKLGWRLFQNVMLQWLRSSCKVKQTLHKHNIFQHNHSPTGGVGAIKAASIYHPHQTQSCSQLSLDNLRGNQQEQWQQHNNTFNHLNYKMSSLLSGDTLPLICKITGERRRSNINLLICVIMFSGNGDGYFSEFANVKLCETPGWRIYANMRTSSR